MRRRSAGLWIAAAAGYAFLYLPLVIVVVYSFNDSRLNAEWVGFTFSWYDKLFHNDEMLTAAANSLLIALTASLVATVLGTMAGVAMYRYKLRLLPVLVLTPIAIPEILMGVALLIFFVLLNFTLGLFSVALSHIAFCIGFVAIVVRARLAGMDESLTEAARDCGATPFEAFRYVTLPLIMPGVIAGALMSFITAINELSSSLILYVGRTMTMPVRIYLSVLDGQFGTASALSTILLAATGLAVFVVFRITGRKESAFV